MLFHIVFMLLLSFVSVYAGSVHVNGYYRSNGTYVAPHYRSSPDGNFNNNWSTKGNINPYTGKEGTKTINSSSLSPSYDGSNVEMSSSPFKEEAPSSD